MIFLVKSKSMKVFIISQSERRFLKFGGKEILERSRNFVTKSHFSTFATTKFSYLEIANDSKMLLTLLTRATAVSSKGSLSFIFQLWLSTACLNFAKSG